MLQEVVDIMDELKGDLSYAAYLANLVVEAGERDEVR